jgi:site-specific recombinase XerD
MFVTVSQGIVAYKERYLASRNFAVRTRQEYLTDLRQLAEYLQSVDVTAVHRVQRAHLDGFLAHLDQRSLSSSTRRRKIAAVRSFFRFLEGVGRVGNPAADVVTPPLESSQPRYLTQQEYERLRRAARHEPRDAAIIELLLQTGLRLSEVAILRLTDVELPERSGRSPESVGSVRVWHGRRHRMVSLNSKVCEALRGYLLIRPADAGDDLVFQSKFRRGMGPRSIEDAVNKYLRAAGIRGASVHSLRHTFATHSVKRGTSTEVLQKALGNASPKTVEVYKDLARVEMDRQLQEHAL